MEDKTVEYWVLGMSRFFPGHGDIYYFPSVWRSPEDQEKFTTTEAFRPFRDAILKDASTPPSVVHVKFEQEEGAAKAFGAPVTELILATLKSDSASDREIAEKHMTNTHLVLGEVTGALGSAHGITKENEKQYVYIGGWETVEVRHFRFCLIMTAIYISAMSLQDHSNLLQHSKAQEFMAPIFLVADLDTKHVKLQMS